MAANLWKHPTYKIKLLQTYLSTMKTESRTLYEAVPKLFPDHVLGDMTFRLTSFVSRSPGTIADQWECKDLDGTTKASDIGRKEFWDKPRI